MSDPKREDQTENTCQRCQAPLPEGSGLPLCDECFTASCDSCCADQKD